MLNLYSLNAATNAMKLAKQAGVRIDAEAESPIGLLNRATNQTSVYDSTITDEQFFQRLPDETALPKPALGTGEESVVIDNAQGGTVLSIDDHEPTLFELRKLAVQRCNGMLDFARNVIQPFVADVIKNNEIAAVTQVQEDWAIEPVALDSSVDEPIVQGLMAAVDSKTANGVIHDPYRINVPDALEAPVTGSRSFDELVARLLSELSLTPTQAVREMLEGSFEQPASDQAPSFVKRQVLRLLLTAYYVEKPWEDSGVTAMAWKAAFGKMHYVYIGWIAMFAEQVAERIQTGRLVYRYDTGEKKVFVCQEALDEYLEGGGAVEALLGAIYMLDEGDSTVRVNKTALMEKQTQFIQAWERRSTILRMSQDTDWLSKNRQSLKTAFSVALANGDAETYGHNAQGDLYTLAEIRGAVNSAIDHLFNRTTTDIAAFVIRTACTEVFGEYDLANLMLTIHEGMIAGTQPAQSANHWIIEYVLDWLLGGVVVTVPGN